MRLARWSRALGFLSGDSNLPAFDENLRSNSGQHGKDTDRLSPHEAELKHALQNLVTALPDDAVRFTEMLSRGVNDKTPEDEKYRIAEALAYAVYPKYKFSEYARLFLEDEAFLKYYERFMDPGNWHSLDRKFTLDQLLKLTVHIEGDAAECGVYKGASSYLICRAVKPYGKFNHLFDSFEGLSAPIDRDGTYWVPGALRADESHVYENLSEFGNFVVHRGWIPERFRDVAEKRFCFVHIDVDLYEPTRDSVEFFYERLSPGGIMLLDDYGFATCPGAKAAADEFFGSKPEQIVMLTSGQAFIMRRSDR